MATLLFAQEIQSTRWERPVFEPPAVHAFEREGKTWFTVQANNSSAKIVLTEIARASRNRLQGAEMFESSNVLVTVDLDARPLEQVLEYVLGELGFVFRLMDDTIEIIDPGSLDPETRLDLAQSAWIQASLRFPEHESAPHARLSLGEIAEHRGLQSAARNYYMTLIDDYPKSELIGEAYMRSGRIAANQGQWAEAARMFRTLATHEEMPDYHAAARLEWARTMTSQGDPQSALYMLTALDSNYPTDDVSERTARRLVRARAYNARGLHMEALRELDLRDNRFDRLAARQALAVRAESLEGIGMPGEAARAWLLYADQAHGTDEASAYLASARLALDAGDELGVLFIVRQAASRGIEVGLGAIEREARTRLGLEVEEEKQDLATRLLHIESLIEDRDFVPARELLRPIHMARGALEQPVAARASVAWARCVEDEQGLQMAIDLLATLRSDFSDPEAHRILDVGAAHLLESLGRFDAAIEAYQGRYSTR